jgi:hypothetical protein
MQFWFWKKIRLGLQSPPAVFSVFFIIPVRGKFGVRPVVNPQCHPKGQHPASPNAPSIIPGGRKPSRPSGFWAGVSQNPKTGPGSRRRNPLSSVSWWWSWVFGAVPGRVVCGPVGLSVSWGSFGCLSATLSGRRFLRCFQRFVSVFSAQKHPGRILSDGGSLSRISGVANGGVGNFSGEISSAEDWQEDGSILPGSGMDALDFMEV